MAPLFAYSIALEYLNQVFVVVVLDDLRESLMNLSGPAISVCLKRLIASPFNTNQAINTSFQNN
jgi:hypothetical protein